MSAGKWQEGRPRWVEHLQQERSAQQAELAGLGSHAAAVDLCLEAARMARDAGVEGALRAEQHWLPHGTMQVCPPSLVAPLYVALLPLLK